MNIAILSGKGGTGKTTVSTNLALTLGANYVDCDVEEPNGFIFMNPVVHQEVPVIVDYPVIHQDKCIACGACVEQCQFHALAKVVDEIFLFEKLCHGCGACELVCPQQAITYGQRQLGKIEYGKMGTIQCSRGLLQVGEPMAVPVIRQLLRGLPSGLNVLDCPPGTSCNVVNTLKHADRAILVTEPTVFGLHDLQRAVELVRMFQVPFGIIVNKGSEDNRIIEQYCQQQQIPLIGIIPYQKAVAEIYSRGERLCDIKQYNEMFAQLAHKAEEVLSWN